MADTMNNSIDRRFDILKQKAAQDVRQGQQEAQKGLTRQFARLGGIGTGAFVKQQRLSQEAGQKQLGEAQQNIEFQKLGEIQRQEDIDKQMKFQTSERLGDQEFQSGMLGKQQEFARGERMGAQEFAAAQAEFQRKYTTGERIASQDFQRDMFDESQAITRDQLQVAQDQLGMEQNVNFLNARLQIAEGIKKGLFGFDDLAALNSMFGIEIPTQQSGTNLSPVSGSSEQLNTIREKFAKINQVGPTSLSTANQKALQRKLIFDEALKMGLTKQQLAKAGITGY